MTTDAARGASPLLLGDGRRVRRMQHTFIDSSFFGAALLAHMGMLDEAKPMCIAPQPDFRHFLEDIREQRFTA
jgi:hypothetical protein